MQPFVTAGGGFLFAVLWFDLMHDVQVRPYRDEPVPEGVVASIAAYYRRVTTDARPMNRLVALVMVLTLVAIAVQLVGDTTDDWVAVISLLLAAFPIGLAGARVVPTAVRLGARTEPADVQMRAARQIYVDHLRCIVAITALLALQLVAA